jgi:hypothetical protein
MSQTELGITVLSYSSAALSVLASTSKRGAEYVKALGMRADIFAMIGLMLGCAYYGDRYGFEAAIVRQVVSLAITIAISGSAVPYMVNRVCDIFKRGTKACGVSFRLAFSAVILAAFIVLDTYIGDVILKEMGSERKPASRSKKLVTWDTPADSQTMMRFNAMIKNRGYDPGSERDLETTLDATPPPQ